MSWGHETKVADVDTALERVQDGDTLLVGGFGDAGRPDYLLEQLRRHKPKDLTVVSNNAGRDQYSLGGLIHDRCVRRLICSFPTGQGSGGFRALLDAGLIELELVPQGVLTERLRAAAAGVVAFYLPAPLGTDFVDPSALSELDGVVVQRYRALHGHVAFVAGAVVDTAGNISCRLSARNFNPVMSRAASVTIVEARALVPLGSLDPDSIHVPGVAVDYVVPLQPEGAQNSAVVGR